MTTRRSVLSLLSAMVLAAAGWGGWLVYQRAQPAPLALSASERAALEAGRTFAVDVFSYDRSSFDADFNRALGLTTADLTAQVQNTKSAVQASLASGAIIATTAQVKAAAVESSDGAQVKLLVVAETYSVDPSDRSTDTGQRRLAVTMIERNGAWLASALAVIGYR